MNRKRDEEIEEENKETLKRRRMMKEKQETEKDKTLPIPDPESGGQLDNQVISGTPTSAASTAPVNMAAGGVNPNTANLFQQLLMQQNQMQQQNQTFMT